MKICIICKLELSEDKFHKDKSRKDGLNPRCKQCKSNIDSTYRITHAQQIKDINKTYYQENSDKIKERASNWYKNNTEQHNSRMKQYFHDNKDKIKEKQQIWNENNKQKMQDYMNQYIKQKYREDINYKVKSILSSRLRSCVKNKSESTLDFIGCSLNEFIIWIEYQFDDNMNWKNCGTYWHFDHVKPCASFDLSKNEDILSCFNWKNIRPLEAKENMSKGNRIDQSIIQTHNKLVESFITRCTKE